MLEGEIATDPAAGEWSGEVDKLTAEARAWLAETGLGIDYAEGGEGGIEAEPKGLALTLHYRNAPDIEAAHALATDWAQAASRRSGMRTVFGKLNVELVPPVKADKGIAIGKLVEGFACCLYAGDDVGDLPAFVALKEWKHPSLCLAVMSRDVPQDLSAAADASVDGPSGILDLLGAIDSFGG